MFASLRIATLACLGLSFGLVASPRLARAEGLPGGATLEFNQLYVQKNGEDDLSTLSGDTQLKYHFNLAHCECSRSSNDSEFHEGTFIWEVQLKGRSQSVTRAGTVWVGTECSNNETRANTCTELTDLAIEDLDTLANRPERIRVPTFNALNPKLDPGSKCVDRTGDAFTWIGVDGDENGDLDYWVSKSVKVDTQPPVRPSAVTARPGEGSVKMSWTPPTSRATDTLNYQFFCATADGEPAHAEEGTPKFQTSADLCDATSSSITFVSTGEAGTAPAWLANVETDFRYLCGNAGGTAKSATLSNLQAGVPYQIAMVAIDASGNAIGQYVPDTVVPTSVIDFWEDLHEQGSDVEGGFCIAGFTFGDDSGMSRQLRAFRDDTLGSSSAGRWLTARYYEASSWLAPWAGSTALRVAAAVVLTPVALLALAWHFLTLPGALMLLALGVLAWRKRAGIAARLQGRLQSKLARASAAAAALLVVLGWAGVSSAQSSLDPYWDEDNAGFGDDSYEVNWHAGIKLGPYTPAIDAQFGGSGEGPYEAMFGGYAIVPMLDVDYIFMQTELGQIGFGGSIGFLNKKASAFAMDSTPGPDRPRTAEHNRFRMVPLAATAVFRLTYLDDKLRIPLVPYVRGGLAYHLWWAEAPDGGVSSVCREGGTTCDENKGRGGSLGVVGSLGIAVRAENIDFEAASAMREGGIQHAGFYAEVQSSKVDDFGVGNKLAVGDSLTWFAGVDFEF